MTQLDFIKMTGAGNDFVIVDNITQLYHLTWAGITPGICDRKYGIGADGLIVIEPSRDADFRMLYYNADGSYGGMCGNGGRCAAAYIMSRRGTQRVRFEALDYIYQAEKSDCLIRLKMKDPKGFKPDVNVEYKGDVLPVAFIDTGAPHAIVFTDRIGESIRKEIDEAGILSAGRTIRSAPQFAPDGTNTDFLMINRDKTVSMRTYERGVEDETLACGTGAVASAVVASLQHGLKPPVTIVTRSREHLIVDFRITGDTVTDVSLTGPAVEVFSGKIDLD